MSDPGRRFEDAPAGKPQMIERLPDAVDHRLAGVMGVQRRGAGGLPFLCRQQIGEYPAFLQPVSSMAGTATPVEDRLGELAPAGIADEPFPLILARRAVFLCQGLEDADSLDIGGNLFLRPARTDAAVRANPEIGRPLIGFYSGAISTISLSTISFAMCGIWLR
jgi:hypothetical protein